jgi:hypothetical protein
LPRELEERLRSGEEEAARFLEGLREEVRFRSWEGDGGRFFAEEQEEDLPRLPLLEREPDVLRWPSVEGDDVGFFLDEREDRLLGFPDCDGEENVEWDPLDVGASFLVLTLDFLLEWWGTSMVGGTGPEWLLLAEPVLLRLAVPSAGSS